MIEWRQLLDDLGVDWIDRGKNTSRGNINISCPFCGDDPSYHLSISEVKEAFYCYREPSRHSGTSLARVLVALGVAYIDTSDILNRYNTEVAAQARKPQKPASAIAKMWQSFTSAAESPACLDYLSSRGFTSPVSVSRQYDLRFAKVGRWAQRLLLPIRLDGEIVTWTGRDIRGTLSAKYLTESVSQPIVYMPRAVRETLIYVEGPLDALKIAAACGPDISAMAGLGKNANLAKLELIAKHAAPCTRILVTTDQDVVLTDVMALVYELSSLVDCPVGHLGLPYGYKDPAELSLDEISEWLSEVKI